LELDFLLIAPLKKHNNKAAYRGIFHKTRCELSSHPVILPICFAPREVAEAIEMTLYLFYYMAPFFAIPPARGNMKPCFLT
jgi:hypothetical protein